MAATVYYSDVNGENFTLITEAFNPYVNRVKNAIDSATFNVRDIHEENVSTQRAIWDARKDVIDIKIIGEDDHVLFIGVITTITGDRILTIHCKSTAEKFKWYDVHLGDMLEPRYLQNDITKFPVHGIKKATITPIWT